MREPRGGKHREEQETASPMTEQSKFSARQASRKIASTPRIYQIKCDSQRMKKNRKIAWSNDRPVRLVRSEAGDRELGEHVRE